MGKGSRNRSKAEERWLELFPWLRPVVRVSFRVAYFGTRTSKSSESGWRKIIEGVKLEEG